MSKSGQSLRIFAVDSQTFYKLQVFTLMMVCFMISYLYTFIWGMASTEPFAIEYEGHVLWACLQLAKGTNIYDPASLNSAPWSVIIYNPLYFVLGSGLIKLFGPNYIGLRILSMASALVSFVGFAALLKRCRLSDFHTILAVALFACTLPSIHWSSVARVDFLGLALAAWSMERFTTAWLKGNNASEPGERDRFSPAAVSLAAAAFFCKQQYFVFAAAAVIFCLLNGQKRLAMRYAATWGAVTLTICACLQIICGGYLEHLTYASKLPWQWETLQLFLLPFLQDPKSIVSLAIFLFYLKKKNSLPTKDNSSIIALPAIMLILSLSLAIYTMGLAGAYHNHLLCSEFALFWLLAICLSRLPKYFSAPAILAAALSMEAVFSFAGDIIWRSWMIPDTVTTLNTLKQLKPTKKLVLSEDPALAVFAGLSPAIVDATTFLNTVESHPAIMRQLIKDIENQTYAAIIINTHDAREHREHIWQDSIVEAISKNYKISGKSGGNGMKQTVYLPRQVAEINR